MQLGWYLGCFLMGLWTASAQGSKVDYERALSLAQRTENAIFHHQVQPHWILSGRQFWYKISTGTNSEEYVWVDAEREVREPALDSTRFADALSKALTHAVDPARTGIESVDFSTNRSSMTFRSDGRRWTCDLLDYQVSERPGEGPLENAPSLIEIPRASRTTGIETHIQFENRTQSDVELFWLDSTGGRKGYGRLRPGQERRQHTFAGHVWLVTDRTGVVMGAYQAEGNGIHVRLDESAKPLPESGEGKRPEPLFSVSPNGASTVTLRDHNVFLQKGSVEPPKQITWDGRADDAYSGTVYWSPDSKRFVVLQTQSPEDHKVHFVESNPSTQVQPILRTIDYLKPGDRVAHPRPRLFRAEQASQIPVLEDLFPNPYDVSEIRWLPDSRHFTFLYNERGHQTLRLVKVDSETGKASALIDEKSSTFVDYSGKFLLHWVDVSHELIWMSERDGWCHLYLIDSATGQVKNAITHGNWVVRKVESVDEAKRQIWFLAGGIRDGQDPYYLHLCRVNFDGSGLVVLTEGDGTHRVEFSPDRRIFLDTWSRVDLPPISECRDSQTGRKICDLEHSNLVDLESRGWTVPERFVAKARDGKTDIFGIIIRPSTFDPQKHYPIVEEIYAGPHGAHVPKEFWRLTRQHTIAELGFIVVQMDGMGTSWRSKAFHDVCWKNLGDAGFPDRKAWIRSAAVSRPWMDLTRVGIYGGSAGGQSAMRALIDHNDFYGVAVADCGCHDNRMDKIWWNELWMGWPLGPHYLEASNAVQAHKMKGKLLLVVGELDENVDPASTLQVVHALEKADKDFDLLVMTGTGHGAAETPYGSRRRMDFLVRNLHHKEPRWE